MLCSHFLTHFLRFARVIQSIDVAVVASSSTVHTIIRWYLYGGATALNTIYIMQIKNENVARTYKHKLAHARAQRSSFIWNWRHSDERCGWSGAVPSVTALTEDWCRMQTRTCKQFLHPKNDQEWKSKKWPTISIKYNNSDVWFVKVMVDANRKRIITFKIHTKHTKKWLVLLEASIFELHVVYKLCASVI